ncbi:MAG: putative competence-damage inducible protein [Phycisphaeraceae bacterium]|nr:MAG: putative competence-damage inducible protein [Phycisphaeraceae bacterium]
MADSHRTAAVLAIGDELTLGQTLDTNSRWLSERLSELGVEVREHATVPDDADAIADAIDRLAGSVDLLVMSGGLGPTADDLTRQALAEALGEDLVTDNAALRVVRAWFEGHGRVMPERNSVQALRPASARTLANEHGTAPGLAARIGERAGSSAGACDVYCLPGPPRELGPMFEREVAPAVRVAPDRVILTRALPTFGMGESAVAEALGGLMDRDRAPVVGTTASRGVVTCRIRYDGAGPRADAERLLDATEADVRERLGPAVLRTGGGNESLVEVTAELLRAHGWTVCTVESCTGGLLGGALTDLPGSSAYYAGGFVTYSNDLKRDLVGVSEDLITEHGAVSAPVAREMASGGLERTGADHALAITGIAGPGGGTPDKPVGTVWIASVARTGPADVRRFVFRGSRVAVRAWAWRTALGMLRLGLIGQDMPMLGEAERA